MRIFGRDRADAFQSKVAAVSGAGSGIGRALALGLAARGAGVAVSDVDARGLQGTTDLLRAQSTDPHSAVVDVADETEVAAWAAEVAEHFGVVHQVYNNAGVGAPMSSVADTPPAVYARLLGINLWGVIHGTRAFLPHVIASGDGHVVNMSSLHGLVAQPNLSAYVTTKFAVRGFTETLRTEMLRADLPVRVTAVYPAGVATNIAHHAKVTALADLRAEAAGAPGGPAGGGREAAIESEAAAFGALLTTSADTAASAILTGVAKGRARVLVGEARQLDALARLLPSASARLMVAFDRKTFGSSSTGGDARRRQRRSGPCP
ncbi:SDR family NAD(P)-dependent oxidoreductase [Isoptericola cucumis]|uniref:Short-chain type dehydrogenase/reductase n=1 Tax=Isoptericola cucumis TaxID=1776856 RepID=A0ABQ2BBL1_9MICO|nr:SDR family NAD(P)-dependent oxidoreductase [Isoptericola cucumis]GGI10761.1 short-chain type dehydrogenase/reductase [Isoptericola cucumis]